MDVKTATIDLFAVNSETFDMDKTDYLVWLGNKGIPVSILTRLESLWDITKQIGKTTINMGKIIIMKIVEFIEAHPHAAIGMALGATIGALVTLVPFIGPLLAPISTAIGAVYGFCVGSKLDYCADNQPGTAFEGLVLLAKDFFATLAEIFCILKDELIGKDCHGKA